MLLIASSPSYMEGGSIGTKIAGIILASHSSGIGELSFLGLTHYYGHLSLASWGSGTGAAGLIGAGAYAVATTSFGFGVRSTILAFSVLPSVMVAAFFFVLPKGPLLVASPEIGGEYETIIDQETLAAEDRNVAEEELNAIEEDSNDQLGASQHSSELQKSFHSGHESRAWYLFKINLRRAGGLFYP